MIGPGILPEVWNPWASQPDMLMGQRPHGITPWEGNPRAISGWIPVPAFAGPDLRTAGMTVLREGVIPDFRYQESRVEGLFNSAPAT
jgi:hypothetical protein